LGSRVFRWPAGGGLFLLLLLFRFVTVENVAVVAADVYVA
jgi:hypothetical protein